MTYREKLNLVEGVEIGESASVWTASTIMDRKLRRLGLDLIYEGERHSQFKVPKAQINIRRKSRVSASAKAKAAERMKSLHQKGGSAAAHPTVMRRYRVSGGRVAEERLEVEILK